MIKDLVLRLRGSVDAAAKSLPKMLADIAKRSAVAVAAVTGFVAVVKRWGKELDGAKPRLEDVVAKLVRFRGAVVAAKVVVSLTAAVAALGAALLAASTYAADYVVQQRQMAEGLAVSFRGFQRASIATEAYGVDIQGLANILGTLTDRVQSAREGNEQIVKDFRAMGVRLEDLKGKDPIGLFRAFADGLAKTGGSAKSTAASMRTFGGDAVKILPLLRGGTQRLDEMARAAQRMGIIFSDESAASAEEYAGRIGELTAQLRGLGAAISIAVVPAGKELIDVFSGWIRSAAPAVIWSTTKASDALAASLRALIGPAQDLAKLLLYGALVSSVGALGAATWSLRGALLGLRVLLPHIGTILLTVARTFVTAVAPVLLLGAAVDDLISYFRGGRSATGYLVEGLKDLARWFGSFQVVQDYLTIVRNLSQALIYLGASAIGRVVRDLQLLRQYLQPVVDLVWMLWGGLKKVGGSLGALAGDVVSTFAREGARVSGSVSPLQGAASASQRVGSGGFADAARAGFSAGQRTSSVSQQVAITVQGVTGEEVAQTINRELGGLAAELMVAGTR